MTDNKRKLKYYLSDSIDAIYNNGNPIYLDIRAFLLRIDCNMTKTKVDFLISAILSTGLVEPVKEMDIDLGDYFDTGELKMTNYGMFEMSEYGSFLKYWYSPRQRLNRFFKYYLTPIYNKLKEVLTPLNTLITIISTSVALILSTTKMNTEKTMERISKDNSMLIQIVDSLNIEITKQRQQYQTLKHKDSVGIK